PDPASGVLISTSALMSVVPPPLSMSRPNSRNRTTSKARTAITIASVLPPPRLSLTTTVSLSCSAIGSLLVLGCGGNAGCLAPVPAWCRIAARRRQIPRSLPRPSESGWHGHSDVISVWYKGGILNEACRDFGKPACGFLQQRALAGSC